MAIYKGAFYKEDILFPNIALTIIGVGYVFIRIISELFAKKDKTEKRVILYNILSVLVIALPVAYILPLVFKTYSSLSNTIYEVLRYVNFCIIYYIVKKSNIQNIYLKCIILIGVILSVLGIDQMTYRLLEPFLNKLSTGYLNSDRQRLSATIQYANIAGVIILLSYIFICSKIEKLMVSLKENKYKVGLLLTILPLETIAAILTSSRLVIAGIAIFNAAILIYMFLNKKLLNAAVLFVPYLAGTIMSGIIMNNIHNNQYTGTLVLIGISIGITMLIYAI